MIQNETVCPDFMTARANRGAPRCGIRAPSAYCQIFWAFDADVILAGERT
jgi:hypothetical protein